MNYTDLTDAQFRQAMQEFKTESDTRHQENVRRMDSIDTRFDTLAASMTEIKKDTGQIVTLFKASQLGATIIKWCATVGGGAIVAYAAIKGLTIK